MLSRLLSNLDGIEASLLAGDGSVIEGDLERDLSLIHDAARLGLGDLREIWIEAETTTVAAALRGGASLWLTSDVLPVGRMSHEARTLRPVIEDLIEV